MTALPSRPLPYPFRLRTKRLVLRSPSESDSLRLNRLARESFPELNRWLPWCKTPPTPEASRQFARESASRFVLGTAYTFRIVLARERKLIGCVGLHSQDPAVPSFEIGYWLATEHTGKGYMTEAVEALVAWAHFRFKARRIVIRADHRNRASWSIPERLGFRREGLLRNAYRDNAGQLASFRVYAKTFGDEDSET
jgi:RimJ/RimL family protein N-acetyltransferase